MPSESGALQYHSITHADRARSYAVYVPHEHAGHGLARHTAPLPILMALHGAGGTARFLLKESGLDRAADAHGFVLVLPEGDRANPQRIAQFERNPQTWNDGSGRFFSGEHNIDDVGFLRAVLADIRTKFSIDPAPAFLVGISNGGAMAFRFATEAPELLCALTVIAGYWMQPVAQLATPRSLLYITGAADPITPINGGEVHLPWGSMGYRPPPRDSVVAWAAACGCANPSTMLEIAPGVTREDFSASCRSDIRIHAYTVADLGHVWPGGRPILPATLVGPGSDRLRANDVMWEFFQK